MADKGFFMLAGNVVTDLVMEDICQILVDNDLPAEIKKGELKVKVKHQAKIYFREGFDHEFILVGHAREKNHLLELLENIGAVLQANSIQFSYELYDRENNPFAEFEFQP